MYVCSCVCVYVTYLYAGDTHIHTHILRGTHAYYHSYLENVRVGSMSYVCCLEGENCYILGLK